MSFEDVAEAPGRGAQKARRSAGAPRRKRDGAAEQAPGDMVKERLLAGGGMSPDRLPLLRVVLDEMASAFERELRKSGFPSPRFTVEGLAAARTAEALGAVEGRALTAAYGDAESDSRIVAAVERRFVFAMVEGLFGADGTEPFYDEERALTGIESRLGRSALDKLAKCLHAAFVSVVNVSPPFDPIEPRPEAAGGGRKSGAALSCRCRLSAFGCESELLLIVPQAVIEPMRAALAIDPTATIQSTDPSWAERMKKRVTQTEVVLRAVMEKRDLTLGDIARLEVGQIVELPVTPTGLIKLECEGQALFWCEIGQKDGAYTIRIEDFVDKEQEFIDDVLGA